jgi:hypothetical protein
MDSDMDANAQHARRLIDRLQRLLPLAVHVKPALSASLRRRHPEASALPSCTVTGVFYAGAEHGIMCRLEIHNGSNASSIVVSSIAHISFDLRHPISREIAGYRKRCAEEHDRGRCLSRKEGGMARKAFPPPVALAADRPPHDMRIP